MVDKLCLDKRLFIIGVSLLSFLFLFQIYWFNGKKNCAPCECPQIMHTVNTTNPIVTKSVERTVSPSVDMIKEYDYGNLADPLKHPARRVPRHEMPPSYFRRMIDLPTSGYPDNFTQMGTLIKKGDPNTNQENKVLRLFGRQIYPGSYTYEYYSMVNSGLDKIKVPIATKGRKELYDGDTVFIKELDEKYDVRLYKFDEPKYYPDIV